MALMHSWESLDTLMLSLNNRLRDVETARRTGVALIGNGVTVDLTKQTFGTRAGSSPGQVAFAASGGDAGLGSWITSLTPNLTSVPVQTGSLLVTVSAFFDVQPGASLVYSWELIGETNIEPDPYRGLRIEAQGERVSQAFSFTFLHTGLVPGDYDVYSRFHGSNGPSMVRNRTIVALPM